MIGLRDFGMVIYEVVVRKYDWFGEFDGFHGLKVVYHCEFVGWCVDEFEVVMLEDFEVVVNLLEVFGDVDWVSDFIFIYVSGVVRFLNGLIEIEIFIGVVVNGVFLGVMKLYDFLVGGC